MENERNNIIRAVTSPLGFFVLSLLIVEGFLAIVLIFSKEPREANFNLWGMVIGALLFSLIVILVWILVWFRPKNLTLEGKHYFNIEKNRIPFVTEEKSETKKGNKEIIGTYIEKIQ